MPPVIDLLQLGIQNDNLGFGVAEQLQLFDRNARYFGMPGKNGGGQEHAQQRRGDEQWILESFHNLSPPSRCILTSLKVS